MNAYVLILILGIWADAPWWFWILFTILFCDSGYVTYKNSN
jgi:hypothetical protein